MQNHKTTAKDFRAFVEHTGYWAERFGLHGWDMSVDHVELGGADAQVSCDAADCWAAVSLGKVVECDDMEALAKHEMLHVCLSRFKHLATSRYVMEREIYEEEERMVRLLEGLIG